jgi:phage anti-repressor protein
MRNAPTTAIKIDGLNVPAITKIGDQLMLSASEIYFHAGNSVIPFTKWFTDLIINNPLTLENDDYVLNESEPTDYLISMDLAKRILMISENHEAYLLMLDLHRVDVLYEYAGLEQ